jgi:hypothetical protein
MSAEEVAKAFVQHYYQTFDANVDGLAGLFVRLFLQINGLSRASVSLQTSAFVFHHSLTHFFDYYYRRTEAC